MNDALIAAIFAIFGGVLTKVLDYLLAAEDREFDQGAQIRNELRQTIDYQTRELAAVRGRLDAAERELDEYRQMYYDLQQENIELRVELAELKNRLAKLEKANDG